MNKPGNSCCPELPVTICFDGSEGKKIQTSNAGALSGVLNGYLDRPIFKITEFLLLQSSSSIHGKTRE